MESPPLFKKNCKRGTEPHEHHVWTDDEATAQGWEWFCQAGHASWLQQQSQGVHVSFGYTFWNEIPWVEGCEVCERLKGLNDRSIGRVIDHWAKVGVVE